MKFKDENDTRQLEIRMESDTRQLEIRTESDTRHVESRMKSDTRQLELRTEKTRASWNNVFGRVQWRSRASWKQRAGWILTSTWRVSLFRISSWRVSLPSGALPKSIWRVSFSGDFIVGLQRIRKNEWITD